MTRHDPLASDNEAGDEQGSTAPEDPAVEDASVEGEDAAPPVFAAALSAQEASIAAIARSPSPSPSPPAPPPPPPPPAAPPPPPPEPVAVPIYWIVEHAAGPVRYRALIDLVRLPTPPQRLAALTYGYAPAMRLALGQGADGTWSSTMLAVPDSKGASFAGVGTILAYRRLLEYGWDRDAPPLSHARRVLFRLLAEDNDATLLYELGERARSDDEVVRRNRTLLREAAAAALAQAGYESDPRLRGAALRLLQRVVTFLRSPAAAHPWETVGGKRVLAAGAAPPTYFFLLMLAHMPLFRLEHAGELDEILKYLTLRAERHETPIADSLPQRLCLTGDPLVDEESADNDLALTLAWFELTARLGYLKRHEGWMRLYNRLLAQCDDAFVWRARRITQTRSAPAFVWPAFPLIAEATPDEQASELTFRLALIARYAGRPLEFV